VRQEEHQEETTMTISPPAEGGSPRRSSSGYDLGPISASEREKLAKTLSPDERRILLEGATERAFCGALLHNKAEGTYACRLCGLPLFRSTTKFESRSGWPSFFEPFDPDHIREINDYSHGMVRTEIRCGRCDSHLGHVFPDGPPPTHLRYCLNSGALQFQAQGVGTA
jgi:peptide-methionine (R)-S-oxide reductase